ncbi:hypothetical protein AB4383_18110 [Vibrio breoganii]
MLASGRQVDAIKVDGVYYEGPFMVDTNDADLKAVIANAVTMTAVVGSDVYDVPTNGSAATMRWMGAMMPTGSTMEIDMHSMSEHGHITCQAAKKRPG